MKDNAMSCQQTCEKQFGYLHSHTGTVLVLMQRLNFTRFPSESRVFESREKFIRRTPEASVRTLLLMRCAKRIADVLIKVTGLTTREHNGAPYM